MARPAGSPGAPGGAAAAGWSGVRGWSGPAASVVVGTVAAYDEPRGLGEVEGPDGIRWPFHCTAIADGTRTIAVGTAVCFVVGPGHRGLTEATGVVRR